MEHLIPFPNFRAADERNKIKQMEDYLYQLREALELSLTDIGPSNFSAAFRLELQRMGMEMQNVQTNSEESKQRVEKVSGAQLSVSDVLNSEAYKASIESVKEEVSAVTSDSCITFPDGTRIEFGKISAVQPMAEGADVPYTMIFFQNEFTDVPVISLYPSKEMDYIDSTCFSAPADSDAYWIAIGKIKPIEEEEG